MYRVRWASWITGVFAAAWMCVALSAKAARGHDDARASSDSTILSRHGATAALRPRGVEPRRVAWIRPTASRRLMSLRDGRVIAGNAVFDGAGGSYLGYASPEVVAVLASGVALSLDADGALARVPIDRGGREVDREVLAGSQAEVVHARPSRDGSLVYVVERRGGTSLMLSIKEARSLREVGVRRLDDFEPTAPVFIRERNGGLVVGGRGVVDPVGGSARSRWIQLQFEGGAPRVVARHEVDGVLEALAVDRAGRVRVAVRRGSQLDVRDPQADETFVSMSARNLKSVVFAPYGDQLAVARGSDGGRTEVSLLSSAPSKESGGMLWQEDVEHHAPTLAFSASGESLYINGHSLLCVGATGAPRADFVTGLPTLFGSWYAVPRSTAWDLVVRRRYQTLGGGATLEESRWSPEMLQRSDDEDLREWGGVVLSIATGIDPSDVSDERFETEMWSDRRGVRHASMRIPGTWSASGREEYVVASEGGSGLSVRRLEVDGWLDAGVVANYRARLMSTRHADGA